MEREAMTRAVLEAVVDRGIRDLAEDPERSLRKLVDMGDELVHGPFQKRYIHIFRQMLQRTDSPYYDMVRGVVENVDRDALRTFGVNMGWQSWAVGAKRIRELEAGKGYHIPWCVTFHLEGGPVLGPEEYLGMVSQAKGQGIYTFFLLAGPGEEGVRLALELSRREPSCAFLLFLEDLPGDLAALAEHPNLLTAVDTRAAGWEGAALRLRAARCLYGVYRRYNGAEEAKDLWSGAWAERILPYTGAFVFCIAGPDCPEEEQERVRQYVEAARSAQRYPMLLIDYYTDLLFVDQIISDGPCFLGVLPDGTATGYSGGREVPLDGGLLKTDLAALLERCCTRI